MSAPLGNPPLELAMTQWADGRQCARSAVVQAVAHRMLQWKDAAEGCQRCGQPALAIRGGVALCGLCRDQQAERSAFAPARDPFARRAIETANDATLRGHAIVFNTLSTDLGGFRERIRPEAVDRMIAERTDLFGLWNHDSSKPIARASAGTLVYRKDRVGLAVEMTPNMAVGDSRDAVERVRDGTVTGMSFAFQALEDEWRMEAGAPVREVVDMRVNEVSPVSFPAYQTTDIGFGRLGMRVDWAHKLHKTRMAR
jgi:HK97 family phage prohead protease